MHALTGSVARPAQGARGRAQPAAWAGRRAGADGGKEWGRCVARACVRVSWRRSAQSSGAGKYICADKVQQKLKTGNTQPWQVAKLTLKGNIIEIKNRDDLFSPPLIDFFTGQHRVHQDEGVGDALSTQTGPGENWNYWSG